MDLGVEGIGAYQPYMDAAGNTVGGTLTGFDEGAGQATDLYNQGASYGDLSSYQNPFQRDVIDTTMAEMNRQQDMDVNSLDARAASARSFGGSRHGIAEAEMTRGFDANRAKTLAGLNREGYTTAQNAMNQHRQRQLQAGQGIAGLTRDRAATGLEGSKIYGQLGQVEQQLGQNDVSMLSTIGSQEQNQFQKGLDIEYNNWQDNKNYDYNQAAFMSDLIQGTPSGQNTMVNKTGPEPSNLSQGIGALGTYATMGNEFGWWGDSD